MPTTIRYGEWLPVNTTTESKETKMSGNELIRTKSHLPSSPVVKRSLMCYSTDTLIDCLPENRPLYKDSGLWQIRTDDMENVYMDQHCNETLRGFIIRYLDWLEEQNQANEVWVDLACRELNS